MRQERETSFPAHLGCETCACRGPADTVYHGAYTVLVSNLSWHIDKSVSRDRNMCDMLWCSLEEHAKASQSVSGKIGAAAVIDGRGAPKERALPLWNDLP